ncbi:MAG TPA: hypothetical protein VK845_08900 [Gemmatimonadales bacterium]|nr:hypothetical protein [Gemmatimonadales bacterium]
MMRWWVGVGLTLLVLVPTPAPAQFFAFGKNKIQYRKFDWRVLRGPHVDLHYYPEEAELATIALEYAEVSYDSLRLKFGHEVPHRVPLILYASHVDFEQTNILPFTPPEGILGATDFAKRRVIMPFRGSMAEFRATLRHEMVHVFELSQVTESYLRAPRATRPRLPLWWTEGLAEWWSAGEDARDEMVLRDLVLTGRLPRLQDLTNASGGLVYPIGGRIHRWLAETYGDWRPALLYQELYRYATFDEAIEGVYGRSLEQLNEEFQFSMRRDYYPTAADRVPLTVAAREVAQQAVKAAYTPGPANEGEAVYLSPRNGYISIFRKNLETGERHTIVTGGRSEDFESFHPFSSRIDVSRPGYLLFSTQRGDRDALIIWDLAEGKPAGRYQFADLVSVLSPVWAIDGQSIFFSGLSLGGISDLYRVWLPDGRLEKLTDDRYQDLDPSVGPEGRRVVFASDRTADGLVGAVNLFVLDLESRDIRQLTSGPWVDETPSWAANGRIYFTSGRDGNLNVFSVDSLGAGRRETSAWTGAFDAALVPEKDALLVSGYNGLSLNLYNYPADSAARADSFPAPARVEAHSTWQWPGPADADQGQANGQPYAQRLTIDIAAGEIVAIPGFGGAQGAAVLMSDMLNDHLLFASVSSYQGSEFGSIFSNINADVIYINQSHRLNWGVGAFRHQGANFEGDRTVAYNEETAGGMAVVRYPLSRYNRVEASMVVEYSDRLDFTLPVDEFRRKGLITSHFVSFVRDNSLWTLTGPIDGGRLSLTAGISSDFSNARFDSFLLTGDWRKYLRLGSKSAYAVRLIGFYSGGDRPRRIYMGGTSGMRGYPLYGRIVGSRAFMLNQEIRFPLLDYLTFGTPLGALRFPEVQGALFFDVGKAWFPQGSERATLGSVGLSLRWALWPFAVVRLDAGRRFSSNDFVGYSLTEDEKTSGFVSVWFGFNY